MLFSSFTFIFVFLLIVWVVFHLLKKVRFKSHYTIAKIFLIISSLFFYAFWKVAYLPILLSSIIVNYTLAKLILKSNSACSDFLGSASAHSLQRTPSASHSFASHNPKNSSTILEFAKSKDLLSSKANAMTLGGGGESLFRF